MRRSSSIDMLQCCQRMLRTHRSIHIDSTKPRRFLTLRPLAGYNIQEYRIAECRVTTTLQITADRPHSLHKLRFVPVKNVKSSHVLTHLKRTLRYTEWFIMKMAAKETHRCWTESLRGQSRRSVRKNWMS